MTDWSTPIALVALIVAIVSVFFTIWYQRKQTQLSSLVLVHQMMSDENARKARGSVYAIHMRFVESKSLNEFEKDNFSVTKVSGDLDIVGSMLKKGLIPEEPFMMTYWGLVRNMWRALDPWVEDQRKKREEVAFREYFEFLNERAMKYRDKKRYEDPVIYRVFIGGPVS